MRDSLCLISLCVSFLSPFISSLFVSFPIHPIPLSSFSLRLICSLLRARGGVRIWVTLLQRSVRSHDHLELRVDIIPYARRLYSLPAKTQLNISLLALSLTALTRMSGSGLNRFSDTNNSFTPVGDYSAIFHGRWPERSVVYKILDSALFQSSTSDLDMEFQIFNPQCFRTMAVLNIGDEVANVLLPDNSRCLAIQLFHKALSSWEIPEDFTWYSMSSPCTFDLIHHNDSSIRIPKAESIRHGMTLRTIYL